MKVRMIHHLSGEWNEGDEWRSYPGVGEVLDTNDAHAMDLLRQGHAEPVAEERKAETRPAPETAEKRAASKPAAAKKGD